MLMTGKHIRQVNDPLSPISVDRLAIEVMNEHGKTKSMIERLRIIRNIDPGQYRILKLELPYIVTSGFHPPIRRKEHFHYSEHLILDIDHVSTTEVNIQNLKDKLRSDPRVMLMFVSPGMDGLKLLFKLKKRIDDSGYFSVLYKKFAIDFSRKYDLENLIDMRTSDVTRCCFMSYDPGCYFNEQCEEIDPPDVINPSESGMWYKEIRDIKAFEKTKNPMAILNPK